MSEEVPMPNPNMETCVFSVQMLKKDVTDALQKFKAQAAKSYDVDDVTIFEEEISAMKTTLGEWKQKFVAAVAACKDYQSLYDTHIKEFSETQTILDTARRFSLHARRKLPAAPETPKSTPISAPSQSSRHNFKLERIKIPTFDGSYSTWEEFHDLFTSAVDSNTTLTPAEKMVYLRTSVTGEALAIIQSFPTTNNAYADAWALLKKRYANPREIAFSLLKKLYEFRRATDSAADLRKAVDLVNEIVRSLTSQRVPVEHWDVILVFWTLKKLDEETRREWLLTQDTALPTLKQFLEFLEKRAHALDDSLGRSKKGSFPPTDNKKFDHSKPNHQQRQNYAHGASYAASGQQKTTPYETTPYGTTPTATTPQSSTAFPNGKCLCCDESYHPLNICPTFASLVPRERSELLKKARLCLNCFSKKHPTYQCQSKFSCRKCDKRHHTLLHYENPTASGPNGSSAASHAANAATAPNTPQCLIGSSNSSQVLLATIKANVLDSKGQPLPARIFVDNGSEVEFVSSDLIRRLGLKPSGTPLQITGIGGVSAPATLGRVKLTLQSRISPFCLSIEAEVVDKLTVGNLPQFQCQPNFPHLAELQLADPEFATPNPVDILLGCRFASLIKSGGLIHGSRGTPTAEQTPFGWILSGGVQAISAPTHFRTGALVVEGSRIGQSTSEGCGLESGNESPVPINQVQGANSNLRPTEENCAQPKNLYDLVEKFWETEEPDCAAIPRSLEDSICESHFLSTTRRDPSGRFIVSLPFRENHQPLGKSLPIAMRRFHSMERRIHQNADIHRAYVDYFRQNLSTGVMEIVPQHSINCAPESSYYMPYSHVVKDSSTSTKVRIVFDCSAKTLNGPSLNQTIYPGPKLQVDLQRLLVKFRTFPYVISADISKFFTQILLDPEQQDFQRLVFREAPDLPILHLRFRRVVFGASASPYLAIRTLHKLFEDECADSEVLKIVKEDILVDNLLTGAFTIPELRRIQEILSATMAKGHFPLCKWASNTDSLLFHIPEGDREVKSPLLLSDPGGLPTLGLRWIPSSDTLSVVISPPIIPRFVTKRNILSACAKLYDPLGWLSPVSIRAKILLQELWKHKLGWDDQVPPTIIKKWTSYCNDLQLLRDFKMPRNYFPPNIKNCAQQNYARYQLYGFSDASNHAHSAVVYLRRSYNAEISVSLVGAKTKVGPIKGETTPRAELDGAKLLVRLISTIISSLPVSIVSISCYTDSTSVLGWLSPCASQKQDVYVLNRVRTITTTLPYAQWKFVSGTENPADCASRGITSSEFLSHPLWHQGPPWLKVIEDPPIPTSFQVLKEPPNPLLRYIMETSSLPKMQIFVASGRRVLRNAFSQVKDTSPLSPAELEEALRTIVKTVQEEVFPEELSLLRRGKRPHSKRIKFLAPFVDDQGLLRVGGRLSQGNIPFDKKHPMLLPTKHHLTEVIIRHLHQKHLHAGANLLLCILRENFWIFDGPATIKRIVRRCVKCHRSKPVPLQQVMGTLPDYRVTAPPRPFTTTALDFAGPFELAVVPGRNPRLLKHYFCVFVCAASKAVHLELVGSLSTPAFIAGLTRFVSRRGCPHTNVSDGGKNFVGAKNELDELHAALNSEKFQTEVTTYATELGITFKFNPPYGPHHGGLFEAAVKSAKFHLRRIIGDRHLSIEEFSTLLTQVEAALNSRPLIPMSSDPSDYNALTPAHFLIGGPLHSIPAEDVSETKPWRLERWGIVQQFSQQFWKRFTLEYLGTLQNRPKWSEPFPNIEVGVLVLVQDTESSFSSTKWNLARITAVHPGPDGKVRVVDVKTSHGKIYRRPITRIAPLPIEHQPILDTTPSSSAPAAREDVPKKQASSKQKKT